MRWPSTARRRHAERAQHARRRTTSRGPGRWSPIMMCENMLGSSSSLKRRGGAGLKTPSVRDDALRRRTCRAKVTLARRPRRQAGRRSRLDWARKPVEPTALQLYASAVAQTEPSVNKSEARRAVAAAMATAAALDLAADDARILQNSNKLAVRLLPCDVLLGWRIEGQAGGAVGDRACSKARRDQGAPWELWAASGAARLRARRLRGHAVDLLLSVTAARGDAGRLARCAASDCTPACGRWMS